jgi:hypothetical protein
MNYSFDASLTDNGVDASTMKNGDNASKPKTQHGHKLHNNANDSTQANAPKWSSSGVDPGNLRDEDSSLVSPETSPLKRGLPQCGTRI